jgi:GT2 family glycosyltransferase
MADPMPPPRAGRLSVVIVTFNSRGSVTAALPALCPQLRDDDELVVVDNASSDDTIGAVRAVAPRARLVENGRNLGFAAAANAGARVARGDVLVFLNPDATPAPGFVDAIAAGSDRWTAWMGLVTAERGRVINTSGGVVHFTGIAWAGEAGTPVAAAPRVAREVAFLSGACLAIGRDDWERLGGFAEAYFMYQEDVDLSLRVRLAGGRVGIEPSAVVDHDYEFGKGTIKWQLLERNRWATIVRCYPVALLALLAPVLAVTEIALLVVAAAGGWLPQKLSAAAQTVAALPRLLRERKAIQATRRIAAADFSAALTPDLDSPFLGRVGRSRLLRSGLRTYWRIVRAALSR